MNPKIIEYIRKERICVLSVVQADGTSHSATVHFSHEENPLSLFIQTSNTSEKAKPFLKGETSKASMVIGFSEQEWLTLQMKGDMKIITDPEALEKAFKTHYKKHPEAEKRKGPDTVILQFTPTWLRYTDFTTRPKTVIEEVR